MKPHLSLGLFPLFLFGQVGQAWAQDESVPQFLTSLNPSFVSWHNKSLRLKGAQFFSPLESISKFSLGSSFVGELGLKSAYIWSQNGSLGAHGTVSTITDTTTHLQFAYEGLDFVQPFVTFDMNLPTGKATLRGREKNALMDPDLAFLTRFGEGWNFNPGVGATFPLGTNVTATLAAGYNFRGPYVPDGDLGFSYNPGNQVILTAGLQYLSETLLLSLTGIFTRESTSTLAGSDFFRPGNSFAVVGRGTYNWTPQHATIASIYFNHTGKNASFDYFTGQFARDEENSNSNLTVLRLGHQYNFTPRVGVFAAAEYLHRDANLYDEVSDLYVAAKNKITGEVGLTVKHSEQITGMVSAGLFTLRQDATPYLAAQNYRGFVGRASLSVAF